MNLFGLLINQVHKSVLVVIAMLWMLKGEREAVTPAGICLEDANMHTGIPEFTRSPLELQRDTTEYKNFWKRLEEGKMYGEATSELLTYLKHRQSLISMLLLYVLQLL